MTEYTGLLATKETLPSRWYYEATYFQKEMEAIFQKNWMYLCHESEMPEVGDYRSFELAGQKILLLRHQDGDIRAFYNSCRHRGSVLCLEEKGSIGGKSITCPYHQWTYNMDGALTSTGRMARADDFNREDYPLHTINLKNWRGFLFVNLDDQTDIEFESIADIGFPAYDHWPLEELIPVETFEKTLACNWKTFWENYNECGHCPEIHPELVDMVPIYGRAIMAPEDDKNFEKHLGKTDPRYAGGLKEGALSWTMTGQPSGPIFPDLEGRELTEGFRFLTIIPTAFFVAHVDYLRVVRIIPVGPEETELKVQWFYRKQDIEAGLCQPEEAVNFAKIVLEQDGFVAEINQAGLKNKAHQAGVLMPQEYELHRLHNWIREKLGPID